MEDRRETGKVDTGMVAVLAIATLLFGTVQWWKLPLDRALERLGPLPRPRHRPPPRPPARGAPPPPQRGGADRRRGTSDKHHGPTPEPPWPGLFI